MKTYKKSTIILSVLIFYLLHFNTILKAQCNGGCHLKYDYTTEITTILPFDTEPCTITVGVKNQMVYFQGDIVLGNIKDISIESNDPVNGVVTNIPQLFWTNSTIPYVIESGFSTNKINEIHNAAEHISVNTNLCVIPRTTEINYVSFRSPIDTLCNSLVGMQGGAQTINLHSLCGFGAAVHEILHAAGVWHEQSRGDRDAHVIINYANIVPHLAFNFDIQPNSRDVGAYDFGSIMHYGEFDFSIDFPRLPTITPINPLPAGTVLGQRDGLSVGDILTINSLYPTPCGASTCNDGVRNGNENGTDCGGSCAPCPPQPTCNDGIKNQGETQVDCGGSCPPCPANTCNFTITNFTTCEVQLSWYDGVNINFGAIIPPSGYVTEQINNGELWSANNTADGSLLTPTFQSATCGGSGSIDASLCSNQMQSSCNDGIQNQGETGVDCGGPCPACPTNTCNFTITNFTNCEVQLSWYDGVNINFGAIIPPSSYVTEQIVDGYMWSANTLDGSLLTPTFRVATCASPTGNLEASLCNVQAPSNCNDGIQNQGETGIDCDGPCSPCLSLDCNLTDGYLNGTISSDFKAKNFILSPFTSEFTTVVANDKGSFIAGKYIELRPGFTANYNSRFDAFIGSCGSLKLADNPIEENVLTIYPNPLRDKGFIEFDLKKKNVVEVFVTDITGKKVVTLLNQESKPAGNHQVVFEREQLSSGIYLCTLIIGEEVHTERLIITQ